MKPKRWTWLGMGVVVGVLATTGFRLLAQPPAGVGPDPTKAWQHRVMSVCAQFDRETSLSEHKARLGWETAGEERRLNLVHTSHERAATLWIAGEVYRNSLHDPASRQVYIQAAGTAHQQHAQAIGAAYNTWAQTVGQTFQSWQQEGGAALQGAQTDNGAAWQSFA
ncbi:MAG: hypothetical protein HY318_14460, partial [Armatimonadetes bacterium]|nr:hypothetical protein [Armatimonadota bacterium]